MLTILIIFITNHFMNNDHQHHDHHPYRRTAVPPADHSDKVVLVRATVLHSERASAVSLVANMKTFVVFVILTNMLKVQRKCLQFPNYHHFVIKPNTFQTWQQLVKN